MDTLATIDLEALTDIVGGQSLPLGAPDLPNVAVNKVCSTANGTFDGGAAVPVGGTWKTTQCVDAKSGKLSGSYSITPSAARRR